MSTMQEQFEAAYLSLNGFHTKAELAREWMTGHLSSEMFRAGYQAATEAAKATGTAGEQDGWKTVPRKMTDEQAKETAYNINRKYKVAGPLSDFLVRQIWEFGIYASPNPPAEAARQPAPALPVKRWEDRANEAIASGASIDHFNGFRDAEIADLRAALAATAVPVLSNISAGLSIPGAKDFDPVGLNPYVVQEADAIPKISLSDDQLDKIARSYFAEEWAQNHLKNAIHDAFITARSQP